MIMLPTNFSLKLRIVSFITIILVMIGFYVFLNETGFIKMMEQPDTFKSYINEMGNWGVILIILLMAFAILFKLLPSAAIALVAGAVYGHTWGGIYIVIGAWLGAVIAFSITRIFGENILYNLYSKKINITYKESQSWLMWGVFISRLIPIIPYDLVSYFMGLTPLKLWRFSLATLIGVIPTSFIIAHIGHEMITLGFRT